MAGGARLGTNYARLGTFRLGVPAPPAPPDPWPPAGLTTDQKIDLLLSYIGPPRTDLLPGTWTLTELILGLYGLTDA